MQNHYINIWSDVMLVLLEAFFPSLLPFHKRLASFSLFCSGFAIIHSRRGQRLETKCGRVSPVQSSWLGQSGGTETKPTIHNDTWELDQGSSPPVVWLRLDKKLPLTPNKQSQDIFFTRERWLLISLSDTEGLECIELVMVPACVTVV